MFCISRAGVNLCLQALCSIIMKMFFASPQCLPCGIISNTALTCSACFHHTATPLQSIESLKNLQYFRSALLANPYPSSVHCDLGKVQRITTQSMLLINHVSDWSATEMQEIGGGQTHFAAHVNC